MDEFSVAVALAATPKQGEARYGGSAAPAGNAKKMRLRRQINIELAVGRVRPTGGQGTARSTFAVPRSQTFRVTSRESDYRNRRKIGFSFFTVVAGQSWRSVTKAESRAECSGQFGSIGMRGIRSTSTFLAVSAFAIR